MSLFDGIFNGLNGLNGSVGQNLDNNPVDIKKTERALNRTGYFNGDYSEGFITGELDKGIRNFQRDNNLKTDGILHPNGETEQALFKKKSIPEPVRKPEIISPTKKGNELLDFIGKLESSDNYNVIYGNEEKALTKMTLKEVQQLQKNMVSSGKGSSAVGRYQIKRDTLSEIANKLGIDENEIFDEKLQDQLARSLMERRGFEKYKAGKISTSDMIYELSKEWAALPPDASNKSRYEGVLNNKSLTKFDVLKELLEKK